MGLKSVTYEDQDGRKWRTLLPSEADDADAAQGIPDGPPNLAALDLPLDIEVRLHNELYRRGLFRFQDLKRQGRTAVAAAVEAAYRTSVEAVIAQYATPESRG